MQQRFQETHYQASNPDITVADWIDGRERLNLEKDTKTYISKRELRSICVEDLEFVNCRPHFQASTHTLTIAPTTAYKEMRGVSEQKKR